MGAVAVIGAGAWGTALAAAIARGGTRDGAPVRLWGRDAVAMRALAASGEHAARLPGVPLPTSLVTTGDLPAALADADIVIVAVPAQALRAVVPLLSPLVPAGTPLVLCAKGIERHTGLFPTEVLEEALPGAMGCVLSGPSFAGDVGRGLPTAVTLAAPTLASAAALAARLGGAALRLYHSDDLRGVEIGGAAKNVLAIACGIAAGQGLGASAVAALTARAFAELSRFGRARGARPETLAGLSGLGDLVLTCGSPQSRNFSYGLALGRGETAAARGVMGGVVEGVWTAPILAQLAAREGIDMPIVAAVAAVIEGTLRVDAAVERLMSRPLRAER